MHYARLCMSLSISQLLVTLETLVSLVRLREHSENARVQRSRVSLSKLAKAKRDKNINMRNLTRKFKDLMFE